jgi:hypothetical protein
MKDRKGNNKQFSLFGGQNASFFQKEEELIARLQQISKATKSPQEIGRELEEFVASFLKDLLPVGFRVETRCRVIDQKGNSSRVIDLAIVNGKFPRLFRASDGSSLLMYESIEHLFELKRSLESKRISDIFSKVNDWINFMIRAEGKKGTKPIDIFKYNYARKFTTLCVESKIELKTIRNKLLEESKKYNNAINPTQLFILRIKENQKLRNLNKSPIGLLCWWEGWKDLAFNLTFAPLSDCIYELYHDLSEKYVLKSVQGYFHWGTVWTRDRLDKYIKKLDTKPK